LNDAVNKGDKLGLNVDLPLPNEWANAFAWILSYFVDANYVKVETTTDVTCPPGSSKYLLYEYDKKIDDVGTGSISIFGFDIPMTTYTATTPRYHNIIKKYGCCKSCGWFHKNTTPWDKKSTDLYDDSHLSEANFGPFHAEVGMRAHTKTTVMSRKCKDAATPDSTWTTTDPPHDFPL
jgi:hypothetical protein